MIIGIFGEIGNLFYLQMSRIIPNFVRRNLVFLLPRRRDANRLDITEFTPIQEP